MPDKIKAVGSRAQVWHETARATSGGLKKKDLFMKKGRIVSRRASAAGKKAIKHLRALGYIAKKGTFKLMSKSMEHKGQSPKKSRGKKSHRKSRATRKRGGFWFEEAKPAATSVGDMMKALNGSNSMGSVKMDSAAKPYGSKQ
jgi:hypothetical protein